VTTCVRRLKTDADRPTGDKKSLKRMNFGVAVSLHNATTPWERGRGGGYWSVTQWMISQTFCDFYCFIVAGSRWRVPSNQDQSVPQRRINTEHWVYNQRAAMSTCVPLSVWRRDDDSSGTPPTYRSERKSNLPILGRAVVMMSINLTLRISADTDKDDLEWPWMPDSTQKYDFRAASKLFLCGSWAFCSD